MLFPLLYVGYVPGSFPQIAGSQDQEASKCMMTRLAREDVHISKLKTRARHIIHVYGRLMQLEFVTPGPMLELF